MKLKRKKRGEKNRKEKKESYAQNEKVVTRERKKKAKNIA